MHSSMGQAACVDTQSEEAFQAMDVFRHMDKWQSGLPDDANDDDDDDPFEPDVSRSILSKPETLVTAASSKTAAAAPLSAESLLSSSFKGNDSAGGRKAEAHVVDCFVYDFSGKKYQFSGKAGLILTHGSKSMKKDLLVLYRHKEQPPLASVPIAHSSFKYEVQNDTFASFLDSKGQAWSVSFGSCEALERFGFELALARFRCGLCELHQDLTTHPSSAECVTVGQWLRLELSLWSVMPSAAEGHDLVQPMESGRSATFEVKNHDWTEHLVGMKNGGRRLVILPAQHFPASFTSQAAFAPFVAVKALVCEVLRGPPASDPAEEAASSSAPLSQKALEREPSGNYKLQPDRLQRLRADLSQLKMAKSEVKLSLHRIETKLDVLISGLVPPSAEDAMDPDVLLLLDHASGKDQMNEVEKGRQRIAQLEAQNEALERKVLQLEQLRQDERQQNETNVRLILNQIFKAIKASLGKGQPETVQMIATHFKTVTEKLLHQPNQETDERQASDSL